MRPTLRQAVERIANAMGLPRGRVAHASRQLQQAGTLPIASGSTAERLEPAQVIALMIAATCDAPIRAIADTTSRLLTAEVQGVDWAHVRGARLSNVLSAAATHGRQVRLSFDPGAGTATVSGWGDMRLEFGDAPQGGPISRTTTITPPAFAAIFS